MRQIVENRLALDCIGMSLENEGHLAVRFAMASFSLDGKVEKRGAPYRITFSPGDDIDAWIFATTPAIEAAGYSPPSEADMAKIKAHALIEWTPEAVANQAQRWNEWEIANEAHCRAQGIKPLTMDQGRMMDFVMRVQISVENWRIEERMHAAGVPPQQRQETMRLLQ